MQKIIFILCLISLLLNVFPSYNPIIQAETTKGIIWDGTLNCNESKGTLDFVVFGEAPDAHDGPPYDSYDTVKAPAPMPPYIRAWFNDNLPSPYDLLWKDYRHYPDTEKVWNLTVQWIDLTGVPTTVTITWSINEIDDSEYTSINLCTQQGVILKNMLLNNQYTFNCSAYVPQHLKIICELNNPPAKPQKPSGETSGKPGIEYTYNTTTTDPDNHQIYYQWDWGDGTTSDWLGPNNSNQIVEARHIWSEKGNYHIKVKAKDSENAESNWSDPLPITMPSSQNYMIDEITNFIHFIICFLKDTDLGMTIIQILRMRNDS